MRKSYLPGATVWSDPRAETILERLNESRRLRHGLAPLKRNKPSTEDVVRERLKDHDKFMRWMNRPARQPFGTEQSRRTK